MLQNSLIYNPAGDDTPVGQPSSGRWPAWLRVPRMVVPRALCTYHRVPCEGVPFYELRQFARLQAQLHSPFVQFGSSAIRQGQVLHLWIWDAVHEQGFAQKHGQPQRFHTVAQSLLAKPQALGVSWLASANGQGLEALLWADKKLKDSLWFEAPPAAHDWQQRLAQDPLLAETGWPAQLPPSAAQAPGHWPWSINLTPRQQPTVQIDWERISRMTLWASAIAVAAWGAWVQGQIRGYQDRILDDQQFQEQKVAQEQPQQKARAQTLNIQQRIRSLQALNANSRVLQALDEVSRLFSRQGLWVRDIDINGLTVEATLVAPPGVTPRLTAILGVIENSELFHDARFVDVAPGAGFRFSWRIEPAVRAGTPEARP